MTKQGGAFLNAEQIRAVEKIAILPSRLANPTIVGKSAHLHCTEGRHHRSRRYESPGCRAGWRGP